MRQEENLLPQSIEKRPVEVVFNRGRELSNTNGLLDARGRKQVMGVIFSALTHIQEDDLMATWWEAVLLDRATPVKHSG
ncbi:MAG: hypothetical protein IPJ06_03080 [Saprospiraceae bacterium]|nr:hypothetical protein [Saprospiraceae bacterium]